jgi:hypothetical protein
MSRRHTREKLACTCIKVLFITFFGLTSGPARCQEPHKEPAQESPKQEPPIDAPTKKEPAKNMRDVAAYLKDCLQPFHKADGAQINVYFSVRRDGRIYGRPRVVWFGSKNENTDERRMILGDFLHSFEACTPLQLSPNLAESIPGKVYYLQFNGSTEGAKVLVRPFGSEGPPLIDDW